MMSSHALTRSIIAKITEIYFDDHVDENLDDNIREIAKKAVIEIVDDNYDDDDIIMIVRELTLPHLIKVYKDNYNDFDQINRLIKEEFFKHLCYGMMYSIFDKEYHLIKTEVSSHIKKYYDDFYRDEKFFSDLDTDDEM